MSESTTNKGPITTASTLVKALLALTLMMMLQDQIKPTLFMYNGNEKCEKMYLVNKSSHPCELEKVSIVWNKGASANWLFWW